MNKMKIEMDKFKLYSSLPTERINKNTIDIDRIPLIRVLEKINKEDQSVPLKIKEEFKDIEKGSLLLSKTFLNRKKIFFIGAGTSGRLGVLEASELPPTYGVDPKQFIAIMAGGKDAVFLSKEGAEDIYEDGYKIINKMAKKGDLIIAIAASGITPYVKGAIDAAKKRKAKTILVTCNKDIKYKNLDIKIAVDIGPEAINGSTRMKSGTATKLILNMLTTSAMIISGKVYRNWMVDLKRTSLKLEMRAERIFSQITKLDLKETKTYLKKAGYNLKRAIVMAKLGVDAKTADKLIKRHKGFLKNIIE